MKTNTGLLRAELIGLGGIVERNIYLIKDTSGGRWRSSYGPSPTR